ncbi:amidase [Geodermatophilus sp. CPCC 206100]|uniref:amidase n=1 Tax=Geodermatophilus sp. CPCC 206100 TaxID=3020054 RepID=UPI003AFF78A6
MGDDVGDDELATLDALASADLVRSGELSAADLVGAAIDRIERLDPGINAVVHRRFEAALEEAAGDLSGPFAGVPMLLKGLGAPVRGEPDHQGNPTLQRLGAAHAHDSSVVRRLRRAGFVLLGRTNVPEFGLVSDTQNAVHGITRNPWNPAHTPSGSSGGSAAAVAAGMVPVAHGTDGGGSIRMPASACGLVGLKPSRGRISDGPGEADPLFGHTTNGVLTRTVRDTAALLDVLAGAEPGDPVVAPAGGAPFLDAARPGAARLRIGVVDRSTSSRWATDPRVSAAVRDVAAVLSDAGHRVVESWPRDLFDEQYWSHWFDALSPAVGLAVEETTGRAAAAGVEPRSDAVTDLWAGRGRQIDAMTHTRALLWLDGFRRRMAGWWSAEGYDVLLSPVQLGPPAEVSSFWSYPGGIRDSVDVLQFTPQFNSTGAPAVSVPAAWTDDDLPIGVQLAGRYGEEATLLRLAAEIEQLRPWAGRRPPVHRAR